MGVLYDIKKAKIAATGIEPSVTTQSRQLRETNIICNGQCVSTL